MCFGITEHFSKLQYDIDRKMQYFANGMVCTQASFYVYRMVIAYISTVSGGPPLYFRVGQGRKTPHDHSMVSPMEVRILNLLDDTRVRLRVSISAGCICGLLPWSVPIAQGSGPCCVYYISRRVGRSGRLRARGFLPEGLRHQDGSLRYMAGFQRQRTSRRSQDISRSSTVCPHNHALTTSEKLNLP